MQPAIPLFPICFITLMTRTTNSSLEVLTFRTYLSFSLFYSLWAIAKIQVQVRNLPCSCLHLRETQSMPSAQSFQPQVLWPQFNENTLELIKGAYVSACCAGWMCYSWSEGNSCDLFNKRGTKSAFGCFNTSNTVCGIILWWCAK